MKLKEQLRWYLNKKNMTSAQLARETGISKSVICDWLAGASPKSIKNVKTVAEVLGICVEELCFGVCKESQCNKINPTTPPAETENDSWISGVFEVKMRRIKPDGEGK